MYPRHHQISMSDQKEKMEEVKLNEDSLLKKYFRILAVVTAYW